MRVLLGLVVLASIVSAGLVASGTIHFDGAPRPPTVAVAAASSVAPVVQQQLDAVEQALASARLAGKAVPVSLVFAETDLQASIAPYFPLVAAGVTFSDPQVRP